MSYYSERQKKLLSDIDVSEANIKSCKLKILALESEIKSKQEELDSVKSAMDRWAERIECRREERLTVADGSKLIKSIDFNELGNYLISTLKANNLYDASKSFLGIGDINIENMSSEDLKRCIKNVAFIDCSDFDVLYNRTVSMKKDVKVLGYRIKDSIYSFQVENRTDLLVMMVQVLAAVRGITDVEELFDLLVTGNSGLNNGKDPYNWLVFDLRHNSVVKRAYKDLVDKNMTVNAFYGDGMLLKTGVVYYETYLKRAFGHIGSEVFKGVEVIAEEVDK